MRRYRIRELRRFLVLGLPLVAGAARVPCRAQAPLPQSGDARGAVTYDAGALSTAVPVAPKFVDPDRQNILAQMWKRRIISPKTDIWSVQDFALLRRIQRAESMDAFRLLREELGSLRGYAVEHEASAKRKKLWLLKVGFERYFFLKSQRARRYFENIGPDAKWVFQIRTLEGTRLFDGRGLLTEAGEELYDRILLGDKVEWQAPSGEVKGNFRPEPSRRKSRSPSPQQSPPSTPGSPRESDKAPSSTPRP